MVLGLKGKVFQVAFPFKEIERLGESEFKYQFEGKQYLIHWDKNTRSAWISNSKGETVPSTLLYWFAWYAFYPETEIFKASQS
ncbi:hypothetical protein JCM19232_3478 [Vibrio ishigakensis]|uniref:DUF3179 domain-containing protein n=2 Tax=Vibrio ishigakensis TaxID=1481914 RepID=A0A0B8PHU2_9VIBR|nr:hypothetical protein JCM19232_3478 [Vibrio ishigakensis]